ncbi:MAG: metal-dependent hydrolase [Candidatus Kariarchaeaceae archaeon]|jgi:hypothetical protein
MTLIPSHLSLEGILLWSVLPEADKKRFNKHRYLFWVILLFSILPDVDIFLGIHRGLSHSLFPPLILAIIGVIIYLNYNSTTNSNLDLKIDAKSGLKSLYGRSAVYASFLWLVHILLDLDYPLAIFYPLSDRLYQINFVYLVDLAPWLFFPLMIVGINLEVTSTSYLRGIQSFFVNLSPSQRTEIFGTNVIPITIEMFFFHFLLFLVFIAIVVRPMNPLPKIKLLDRYKRVKYDGIVFGLGLCFIISGLMMGPLIGLETHEQRTIDSSFRISPEVFSPSVALAIEPNNLFLQPNTVMNIEGLLIIRTNGDSFKHIMLISEQHEYNVFNSDLGALFKVSPPNTTENMIIFKESYKNLREQLYESALAMNLTSSNETVIITRILNKPLILVGLIEDWNDSTVLAGNEITSSVQLSISVKTSRLTLFIIGVGGIICGVITILISVKLKK